MHQIALTPVLLVHNCGMARIQEEPVPMQRQLAAT